MLRPRRRLDRRILRVALPAAGSSLVLVIHRAVDMAWIRALGTDAVASLTISTVAVWMYAAVGWLVAMGLTALVARYAGALRPAAAGYIAAQGLRWAAALGAVCAVVGWFVAPFLFGAADAAPAVREAGLLYTRIYWVGGAFVLLQFAGDAVFRAHGNAQTPFKIAVIALLLNIGLDPLLIWGWGPIPAMGVPGAALATVLAAVAGAAMVLGTLYRHGYLRRTQPAETEMRFRDDTRIGQVNRLGLDRTVFLRMARVGTPTFAASLLFNLILLELLRIASAAGGPAAQAGLGIGHTGEGIAYVLCLGWSAAASSLVGRHMGAGQLQAAERAAWRAGLQCASLCLLWGIVLFVFADELAWLWAKDAAAQGHAASYFRIVSLCLVPQAYELVLDGAFGGAGMTVPPMVVGVTLSLLRIPLAWWAAFDLGLGVEGIWWVICVTAAVRGIAVAYWFSRGTWKTRSV